ncbi:hypothetical protein L596_013529 [Steinernema carpocapsae]|uniref:Uncharacterized protein n=1 Tax=Steinernema carpocapsae TaxID=34508 RepID=A0A4U5P1B0_STECR|nr:hypothetical protein L596_013529 [Steinernema carpocapsae]
MIVLCHRKPWVPSSGCGRGDGMVTTSFRVSTSKGSWLMACLRSKTRPLPIRSETQSEKGERNDASTVPQSQPILRLTIIGSMEVTREEKALVARNLLERTQLQHRSFIASIHLHMKRFIAAQRATNHSPNPMNSQKVHSTIKTTLKTKSVLVKLFGHELRLMLLVAVVEEELLVGLDVFAGEEADSMVAADDHQFLLHVWSLRVVDEP